MSRQFRKQYGVPGVLVDPVNGIAFDFGLTVPTDGTQGYAPGCIFLDVDASAGSQFYINEGTKASCDFNVLTGVGLSGLTATATELNGLDASLASNNLTAGAGISTAETYKTGISRSGALIITRLVVDLTGLVGSATDLDIIGDTGGAASANFGQITAAKSGTLIGGQVTCLEVPAGGSADIDFYSANESTGAQDGLVTALTETALITAGGAWTSGASKGMTTVPPADDYLYIVNGAGAAGGTFSAGKFLIELYGF